MTLISLIFIFTPDNGTEFASVWNSLKDGFYKSDREAFFIYHKTIPPCAKTYQRNVESSHKLIEDEFYACEYFYSFKNFMEKVHQYQKSFNYTLYNTYKRVHTRLLHSCTPEIKTKVLNFKPSVVDFLYPIKIPFVNLPLNLCVGVPSPVKFQKIFFLNFIKILRFLPTGLLKQI